MGGGAVVNLPDPFKLSRIPSQWCKYSSRMFSSADIRHEFYSHSDKTEFLQP